MKLANFSKTLEAKWDFKGMCTLLLMTNLQLPHTPKNWHGIYNFGGVFSKKDPTRISIRLYLIACTLGRMLLTASYRKPGSESFKQYGWFVISHNKKTWQRVPKPALQKHHQGLTFFPFCPYQWAWYLLLVPRWLRESWHQNGHNHSFRPALSSRRKGNLLLRKLF